MGRERADRRRAQRRTDLGRGPRGQAGRARRRWRRSRRLRRPGGCADGPFELRIRGQPRDPGERGNRAGRRRAAGRPARREGRPVRRLGRPPPSVRPDPDQHRRDVRRAGARLAGRRTRRVPRRRDTWRRPAPNSNGWRPGSRRVSAPAVASRRPRRRRPAARSCWPPGPSCSTRGGSPTATRTSPGRRSRRGRCCRPAPRPRPGSAAGDTVRVATASGSIEVPAVIADVVDGVVWLPTNARGCAVRSSLGVTAGAVVTDLAGRAVMRMLAAADTRVRRRPRLRRAAGLDRADQGPRRVRLPGRHDAVLDRVRAQGRRPHAEPHRPEPGRPVGHAAVARRRHEAGLQRRGHPAAGRQAGLLPGPDPVGHPGVPRVLGDPVRARRCRCSATTPRCS